MIIKAFRLSPVEHVIVISIFNATGAVKKMERSKRVTILLLQSIGARWRALDISLDPSHVIGRHGGVKSFFVIVSYVSVVACTNRSNRRQPAITFRICFSRSKDHTNIRPSWRHERRESLSTVRSESNLVCVPASNRESKKVIGLTRGRNSASDLIHELGMEFVLLSPLDCQCKFGSSSRSTSVHSW